MARYCPNCGSKVDSSASFCPNCGSRLNPSGTNKRDFSDDLKKYTDTPDSTSQYDPRDINENKVMAVLCYIGLLWLIPFLAIKNSPFVKFHLNQGLLVLILSVAAEIVRRIPLIRLIGWFAAVAAFAFAVIGIINACQGKAQELPIIGKYKLL